MTSTGETAFTSYAIRKGEIPVEDLGVVLYAQSTFGSSSTQQRGISSILFLRPWKIVRLDTSTWPLASGYATDDFICLIFNSDRTVVNFSLRTVYRCRSREFLEHRNGIQ